MRKILTSYVNCILMMLLTGAGFVYFAYCLFAGEWEWYHLLIFVVAYFAMASGISVGFHRYATHRAFDFSSVGTWLVRPLYLLAGSMAIQNDIMFWVRAHTKHHRHTDDDGDPHSPHCKVTWLGKIGQFIWAHAMWVPYFDPEKEKPVATWFSRFEWFISRRYVYIMIVACPCVVLWFLFGWLGLSALLAAIFALWHSTSAINSVTHLFGSRPMKTPDQSTNLWPLAPFTVGEALHNNHHSAQKSACFARKWWEYCLDLGWWQIWTMHKIGLVQKVHLPTN